MFAAPTDVFLEIGVEQPELLIVCDPAKVSRRGIEGAPDLVVEILSHTAGQNYLTTKRRHYEVAVCPSTCSSTATIAAPSG